MSGIPDKLKLPPKPFRCDICLPIWTTAAMWWAPEWVPSLVATAFGSSIIAPFFRNLLLNLHNYAPWIRK